MYNVLRNNLNLTCRSLANPSKQRKCRRSQAIPDEAEVRYDAVAFVLADDIPIMLLDLATRSSDGEPLTFRFPGCPERAHVSECEFIFTFSHLPHRRDALVSWFWRWGISFRVNMR